MAQTAVDWLFIQLYEKFEMKGDKTYTTRLQNETYGK